MIAPADRRLLDELDTRLRTVLPEEYQDTYEQLQPTPMKATGLKFADDGSVAWDKIWGSFCNLAMAGGPPHKGALLEPAPRSSVTANADHYDEVAREICRGISLATEMPADPSSDPGWVRVECYSDAMAGWLLRAITMENVAVRVEGASVELPASPAFRLDKEIKNVVTVIAKTSHYWLGHMPRWQQRAIASLFQRLDARSSLVVPVWSDDGQRRERDHPRFVSLAERIGATTGLRASHHAYAGWLGMECPSVRGAVWMMRALVVDNVLARREGITLFVPVGTAGEADDARVAEAVLEAHRLASVRGALL